MRINRIIPRTRAEGPGMRFTLWTQGCRTACEGCYSKALWPEDGGDAFSVAALSERIAETPGIEGITLLGGEPLLQAGELAELAAFARSRSLSVVTFTGFLYEDILSRALPEELALLAHTDLLIDGPYRRELRDLSRPWVGSRNQRYLFLTERYRMEDVLRCENRVELRMDGQGAVRINGMGDFEALERLLCDNEMIKGA